MVASKTEKVRPYVRWRACADPGRRASVTTSKPPPGPAPARAGDLADLARRATAWLGSAAGYGSGARRAPWGVRRAVRQRARAQPVLAVQFMPAFVPPQALRCGITAAPQQMTGVLGT